MSAPPAYPHNWPWKLSYPPLSGSGGGFAIPPTDCPQVMVWKATVDMSAVPNLVAVSTDVNGRPINPYSIGVNPGCDYTFDPTCQRPDDVFGCPDKGVWGLTFDDGPTQHSPVLYDYLDSIDQKATLFYIGVAVALHPEIARRACKSGHQIGIHTWSHHAMTSLTNDQIIAELKWTEAIINEVCGITPKYFRPPFGDIDDRVRAIAKQLGFIPVVWDLDTNDWQLETGNTLITPAVEDAAFQRWASLASQDAHGHICLQHEHTASSVNEAIKNIPLLKRVFTVVPVSTCIRDSYPYKEPIFFPVLAPNSTTITSNLALMATRSLIAVPSSSATPIPSSTQNGAAAQMNRSMWVIIAALVGTVLGM